MPTLAAAIVHCMSECLSLRQTNPPEDHTTRSFHHMNQNMSYTIARGGTTGSCSWSGHPQRRLSTYLTPYNWWKQTSQDYHTKLVWSAAAGASEEAIGCIQLFEHGQTTTSIVFVTVFGTISIRTICTRVHVGFIHFAA